MVERYSEEIKHTKISFGRFKYENQSSKIHRFMPSDISVINNEKSFFQKLFEWLKAIIDVFKKIYSAT